MSLLRKFLGLKDIEYVAFHEVFCESSVSVVPPISLEEKWPLVISGPEHHINFLFPLIRKMQKESPLSQDGEGWTGVSHFNARQIYLFYLYSYGKPSLHDLAIERSRRIELLQSKFRNDAARYANLKISEISKIEVVWEDFVVLKERVVLPKDFENGNIVLPAVYLH